MVNWMNPDVRTCPRCNIRMRFMGVEKFRVGGTSGGWKLIFSELAELGEQLVPFEVYVCPQCRHVEFLVPKKSE